VLSGGERSRLAMIRLLLQPVNLLILDEPTNHLDIPSKDVLKKAIREFDGTAIIVSHDRDFLNDLVTKVYEFGGGKVTEHLGGIYEFLSKKKISNLRELEASTTIPTPVVQEEQVTEQSKLSYQEQKEFNRQIRKLEKQIEESEKQIETLESKLNEIESQLSLPEKAYDSELFKQYNETKDKITFTMNKWERLTLELEGKKE